VKAGERIIIPTFAGFVTDIAGYRADAELPEGIEPCRTTLSLLFNGAASEAVSIEVAAVED
jgi:hypothetical protein